MLHSRPLYIGSSTNCVQSLRVASVGFYCFMCPAYIFVGMWENLEGIKYSWMARKTKNWWGVYFAIFLKSPNCWIKTSTTISRYMVFNLSVYLQPTHIAMKKYWHTAHLNAMMLPGQKSLNTTSCKHQLPLGARWHILDCESEMCVCISSTWDCKPFMTEGCFWNGGVLGVCCTNLASRITSFTNPGIVSGGTRS